MLRRGWEASLQQVKEHIINLGVVAALLLSVILGLAVEAPEPVESDDGLADARPRIREAFICLCMLSSIFSITAVAVSVFYVEHVDKVVSAREWLTFDRYFCEEMVEWPVLLSLITLLIALILGPLIVLELPTAAVACGVLTGWSVLTVVMIERSAIRVKKDRRETTTTLRLEYIEIVDEAFREYTVASKKEDTQDGGPPHARAGGSPQAPADRSQEDAAGREYYGNYGPVSSSPGGTAVGHRAPPVRS